MTDRAPVAPVLFALLGVVMLLAGAAILWGIGGALVVAGGFSVAVGVDLARSPRVVRTGPAESSRTGTDFPTADEAQWPA